MKFEGDGIEAHLYVWGQGDELRDLTLLFTLVFVDAGNRGEPSVNVVTTDLGAQQHAIALTAEDQDAGGTWYVFRQVLPSDTIEIEIHSTWRSSDGATHAHQAQTRLVVPVNRSAQIPIRVPEFPRLVDALNRTWVFPHPVDDGASEQAQVEAVLAHLTSRLDQGLAEAWDEASRVAGLRPDPSPSPEEEWARAITEALLCVPYRGPGSLYYGSVMKDYRVWEWFGDHDDPVVPVVAACQHLASIASWSLGATVGTAGGSGLSGGDLDPQGMQQQPSSSLQLSMFRTGGGTWSSDSAHAVTKDAIEAGLRPGGVLFAPDTKNHVAFVLRTNSAIGRLQLFDTGGFSDFNPGGYGVERARTETMDRYSVMSGHDNRRANYDDPVCFIARPSGPRNYKLPTFGGMGILPERMTDGQAYREGARLLRASRPLGFVRLVIARRTAAAGDDPTLFVSRLMRMHHGAHNYPIARLLDSVRSTPLCDRLAVWWVVYMPIGEATSDATRAGGRPRTVEQVVAAAGQPHFHPILVLGNDPDGMARVFAREWILRDSGPHVTTWGPDTGKQSTSGKSRRYGFVTKAKMAEPTFAWVTRRWDEGHNPLGASAPGYLATGL